MELAYELTELCTECEELAVCNMVRILVSNSITVKIVNESNFGVEVENCQSYEFNNLL